MHFFSFLFTTLIGLATTSPIVTAPLECLYKRDEIPKEVVDCVMAAESAVLDNGGEMDLCKCQALCAVEPLSKQGCGRSLKVYFLSQFRFEETAC